MQTASVSRQERRQRLKQLDKVVAGLEQRGLSSAPALVELAALVAIIDDAMGTGVPGSAARAVRCVLAVHDKTHAHAPFAKEAACRKGCAFCCSLYVSASAPQIFAIADHIRRNAPDLATEIARIEMADRATRGRDSRVRFLDKAFCAFG